MDERGNAVLAGRARVLTVLLPAFAAALAAFSACETLGASDPLASPHVTLAAGVVGLAIVVLGLACAVFSGMWLARANANLREAGIEMAFSPTGTWGWYFVPVANLFKPYQAMKEIWNESHRVGDSFAGQEDQLLRWWWGLWIVGGMLSNFSGRIEYGSGTAFGYVLEWGSTVALGGAGLLLLRLIRDVTTAQRNLGQASVFA